jgi:serine kinase of HPr protein (carbohydrate metabolism regulator)
MKTSEIVSKLNLKILTGEGVLDREITGGICCDLLSWVMSHGRKNSLWITVQTHTNVVAVASLLELACILIPESIPVDPKTLEKASEEGIAILQTDMTAYELSGRLFALGIGA